MAKRVVDVERAPAALAPSVKDQHVIWSGNAWVVRSARARRPHSMHETLDEAIGAAKAIVHWPNGPDIVVHHENGRVRHVVSKDLADELSFGSGSASMTAGLREHGGIRGSNATVQGRPGRTLRSAPTVFSRASPIHNPIQASGGRDESRPRGRGFGAASRLM